MRRRICTLCGRTWIVPSSHLPGCFHPCHRCMEKPGILTFPKTYVSRFAEVLKETVADLRNWI